MEAPDVLDRRLDAAPRPYFLAVLRRSPAEPTPEYLDDLVRRRHLTPVSVSAPLLSLYRSPGGRSVP